MLKGKINFLEIITDGCKAPQGNQRHLQKATYYPLAVVETASYFDDKMSGGRTQGSGARLMQQGRKGLIYGSPGQR